MGKRGEGYGSEDHLLRYISEKPEALNRKVVKAVGVDAALVKWLEFPKTSTGDREFRGLEFLPAKAFPEIRAAWKKVWPTRGRQPSWDAIGRIDDTWLLVEAKANTPEFVTPPSHASPSSRKQIVQALNRTKRSLDVHRFHHWDGTYYQYANRLTVLQFLRKHRIDARLLLIYFTGDRFPDGTPCPQTNAEWKQLIEARRLTLGLSKKHALSDFEHHLFLPALAA